MSYYFRQQVAKRFWQEESHPRGKTSPASNAGSFAPAAAINSEVRAVLTEVEQIGHRHLADFRYNKHERARFEKDLQARVRDALGPGYEKPTTVMVDRVWEKFFDLGPHTYREPRSWMREGWAVKCDVQL